MRLKYPNAVSVAKLPQYNMSLLQLPPEIIHQIFNHIGSFFFRSDLSRLTVCKQWMKYAHTACFREFYVTQKTLRRLMSAPYVEPSLLLVKDSLETLNLDLKGFEEWIAIVTLGGAYEHAQRVAWRTELNNDLVHLATGIKESRKLRMLRIQAIGNQHPRLLLPQRHDYLYLSTIPAFLSAGNLTSLELDLCSTQLVPRPSQEHGERVHVCTSIAALLTTLRFLRLRMRTVCADVLKPQQRSTNLRLNEVLINLSLFDESLRIVSAASTTCCGSLTGGFLQLKADLEKQAQVLVMQMAAPKMVRILTHTLPNIEMRAFDVLTGKTVALSEGAKWDDEGEVIEDQISDDESEISDLSWNHDG